MLHQKHHDALKVNWTNKEMDNLSLCNIRSPIRKEAMRLRHLRSSFESKKLYVPYKITLTGTI